MSKLCCSPLLRGHDRLLFFRRMKPTTTGCLKQSHSTLLGQTSHIIVPQTLCERLPATSRQISASASETNLPQLPYHVQRTASQELPVYQLAKRGGNLHQTRIRKIKGDAFVLRDQLQAFLNLKKENTAVNHVTGHIILKGWYRDEVKKFLEQRYF